ncbi:hypothetical protein QKQ25_gp014 [Hyphantria cunea granulovirus]|uniref:Uncharacterized protein n=1 Tax=Hyphantria cunea granulovirus TaxID=307448 RepID=A0AAF1D252_9BBAC|nr:hypothetical protein QKQ25_gp014 [Hyphantria cunea granulovirus]QBQ01567.1 hypothetical protein HycuGV_00014 [Hyphantria cunea granulovirus]
MLLLAPRLKVPKTLYIGDWGSLEKGMICYSFAAPKEFVVKRRHQGGYTLCAPQINEQEPEFVHCEFEGSLEFWHPELERVYKTELKPMTSTFSLLENVIFYLTELVPLNRRGRLRMERVLKITDQHTYVYAPFCDEDDVFVWTVYMHDLFVGIAVYCAQTSFQVSKNLDEFGCFENKNASQSSVVLKANKKLTINQPLPYGWYYTKKNGLCYSAECAEDEDIKISKLKIVKKYQIRKQGKGGIINENDMCIENKYVYY